MTTDFNELYQTLNSYMDEQIEAIESLPSPSSVVYYDTDINVNESLYNKNTFDLIVNNLCNEPNNRLIEYNPKSTSIIFMRGNQKFEIQGNFGLHTENQFDENDDENDDDSDDNDYEEIECYNDDIDFDDVNDYKDKINDKDRKLYYDLLSI